VGHWALILAILSLPACSIAAEARDLVESRHNLSLPFELRHDFLIVVKGRIGNLEPLRFIVDTGSTRTMVSRKVAARFGLPRGLASSIGMNARVNLESAMFSETQIGPLQVINHWMLVGDLEKLSDFGTGIDAILGLDILGRCKAIEIDYAAREIRFTSPWPASGSGRESTDAPRGGVVGGGAGVPFFVPATLQGRMIRLLVDTGVQGIVLSEDRLLAHVGKWKTEETIPARMGFLRIAQVRLRSLWIDSFQIVAPVSIFHGNSAFPEYMDGVLGPRALNARRIALDFDALIARFY